MPIAMKRPAAAASKAEPAAKAPKLTGPMAKVAAGLALAEAPESAQEMLLAMLPGSLGVLSEQRSQYQVEIVNILDKVFKDHEASLQSKLASAQQAAEEHGKSREELDKQLAAAKEDLEAKSKAVLEKKCALADVARTFKACREAASKAEEECLIKDSEADVATRERDTLHGLRTDVQSLSEGGIAEAELPSKIESFCKKLKKYSQDESMLMALPSVLAKAPTARASFDTMVLTQLNGELQKQVETQETTIREAAPAKAARDKALAAAKSEKDEVAKKQVAAAQAYTTERSSEEALEEKISNLVQSIKDHNTSSRNLGRLSHKAEAELGKFQSGPKASFEQLRDAKAPEPAPAEEPAAAAEEATEGASEPAGDA